MQTAKLPIPNRLDRNSYKPLYLQLAQQITACINKGELKSGDRIPSELDLAKELNISRMTVRLAMDELLGHGIVYREQGRGTYIAEPQMKGVRGFSSFTEDMTDRGLATSTRVLENKKTIVSRAVMIEMGLREPREVVQIKRLRFVEGIPWALQATTLPADSVPGLENEDLSQSLFKILREKYQIHPAWTDAKVHARITDEKESALLELPVGSPVLVVHGITYTDSFELVEVVHTVYNAEEVSLYMGRQKVSRG